MMSFKKPVCSRFPIQWLCTRREICQPPLTKKTCYPSELMLNFQALQQSVQKIKPTLQKSFIADYPLYIDSAIFRHQSSTHVIGLTYQNTNKIRHQKGIGNKDGRCGYRLCGRVTWSHHICLCWPANGHTKSENADFSTPISQSRALL